MWGEVIILNPGSGPVEGSTVEHARRNMHAFRRDVGLSDVAIFRLPGAPEGGRWPYRLRRGACDCIVTMPGLPLARVRWVDDQAQNCLDYPRLYVDGNSWLWRYAVSAAISALTGRDHDAAQLTLEPA